jgi:hypothetical protein
VVCVLLVGLCICSRWRGVQGRLSNGITTYVVRGQFSIFVPRTTRWGTEVAGFRIFETNPGFDVWPVLRTRATATYVGIPIPVAITPILIATAAAWRLDTLARRRARVGHCPTCNYDRRGLPAANPCPECGAVPATPAQPST